MRSRQDLIAAYLRRGDSDFWAREEVQALVSQGSDEAIELVLELIGACETDQQLCYVAAGPVEDLLNTRTLPAFARASRDSVKVRRALQAAWLSESEDGYELWKALLKEYGMWQHSDT
jgi:hypothetical protein